MSLLVSQTFGGGPDRTEGGRFPDAPCGNFGGREAHVGAEAIELTIIEFQDYVQPNLALAEGELDANFFQHVPYLEQFSRPSSDLTYIAKVHVEPMGFIHRK